MEISFLQKMLVEAYSVPNLNKISFVLIELYKNEQFEILQKIAEIIEDFVSIKIDGKGKGFSKFMMLYHPDRSFIHINEINRLVAENNFDKLLEFSHILKLERIEEIADSLNSYEDIDYSPVYAWDVDAEGFRIMNDSENEPQAERRFKQKKKCYSFYDAVKIRNYGHTRMEFPTYYLEDIEDFELSGSGINNLDGIQYCIHTRQFDLSENYISDLMPLSGLTAIEELNLSDNEVSDIDAIGFLHNLRSLYLCNNSIEDFSPLFELPNLKYVDLTGNKVDQAQLETFRDLGIQVDY